MSINLGYDEILLLLDCIQFKMSNLATLSFYDAGTAVTVDYLLHDLSTILEKLENELLPFDTIIGEADVEASSQELATALPKRTVSDLDQRGAGDGVSLDQHIQLYKEVF